MRSKEQKASTTHLTPLRIGILASFVVLALAVGAYAGWRILGPSQPEIYPPFTWAGYLADYPREQKKRDWAAVIKQGPLKTQEELEEAIRENRIDAGAMPAFEFLVSDTRSRDAFAKGLAQLDGPSHNKAIETLYATLMLSPANVDVLYEKLNRRIKRALKLTEKKPENQGAYIGWSITINVYAALIAYEQTGDIRFIDLAVDALNRSLALRDDKVGRVDEVRGRVMRGWGGVRYDEQGRHMTNYTLVSRVAFVFALFADTVRRHPELEADYADEAAGFLTAARETTDDYAGEFKLYKDAGFYVRPIHDDVEPLNHMAWGGNALVLLHQLTGEAKYGEMAAQMARYFRSAMRFEDGAVWWPYQALENGDFYSKEFTWKARTTSQFMLFAWERGVVFTDTDMQAIANMVLTRIFRPDGSVSALISSRFLDMEKYKKFRGNYLAITPFIAFECVQPKLRTRIEQMIASRPDIGGWMKGRHGIVGYAFRLGDRSRCQVNSGSAAGG